MADTAVIFSILAKDKTGKTFDDLKTKIAAAFGTAAIVEFGREAISAASDLNETQSKVQQLFGDSAAAVNVFAATAASSLGQTRQQALDAAATFAIFGHSAGLSGSKLVDFSANLTKLATDMASFHNTSPQQAIEAIGAALRGESEPIRAYGVLLDDASLKAEAARMGILHASTSVAHIAAVQMSAQKAQKAYTAAVEQSGKTSAQAQDAHIKLGLAQEALRKATEGTIGTLTPQQKVLAAQSLIMKQTASAQGDFARTSSGLANQQRIMAAEIENARAKIGAGLLPIMLKVMHVIVPMIDFIAKHSDWVLPLATGIALIVGAVKAWSVAQAILDAELWANPIGLIILGVVALIAAIVWVATKTTWFQTIWRAVWGFMKGIGRWFAHDFAGFFVTLWHHIWGFLSGAWGWFGRVWGSIWGMLAGIGHWIAHDFVGFFLHVGRGIHDFLMRIIDGFSTANHMIISRVVGIVSAVSSMPARIARAARTMWTGFVGAARAAFNAVIGAWNRLDFGIHVHLPSWVPGVGGKGFDISDIFPDIPMLAHGGIVTGPTLAMLGEGGHPEVVRPLTGSTPEVRVVIDVRDGADDFKRLLRKMVRVEGGGNVQTALGY